MGFAASATAFSSVSRSSETIPSINGWTADESSFCAGLPGAIAPLGNFDPLEFTKDITVNEIKRYREAEVTHGRVSMLAVLGYLVRDDYYPGDIGFDPLGLKPSDAKEFADIQTKELQNGRLAMLAAIGMIVQEQITHDTIFGTLKSFF